MKQLFTFLLAAMAFVACTQNDVEELTANREALPETLTVGFEGGDTRVELNEALKTVWTEGDEVSVFYRSYENMKWAFQGETGDRSGELKLVSGNVGDQTMDNTIVVYPYNENYKINLSEGGVDASLPAVQSYKDGSYGKEGNIMVAAGEFTQFTLKSVCGWLRVELTGEGEVVESIKVRGNGDEQLAGLCYINAADASVTLASDESYAEEDGEVSGNLNFDDSTFTEVTLDCGEGVELGAGTTYFYIALLPQSFESGIMIEVNFGDDALKIERVNSNLTIQRNHIYPINIAANEEVPSNELWYTSTDGNIVEPYNPTAFDVAIHSNEYANGQGVITFDGDVTLINAEAFRECNTLESISLPDGITEVVEGSFRGCSNLTSFSSKLATANRRALIVDKTLVAFAPKGVTKYTIPAGVARIGAYTFAYSTELLDVTIGNGVEVIGAWSFTRCSELKRAYIASSVHTIEEGAFSYCNKLVIEGDNYESVDGGIRDKDGKWRGPIDIPDDGKIGVGKGTITIGEGAVRNNDGITEVTIPESVQEIEAWAFMGCTSLEKVICKPTTPPAAIFTDGLWQAFDENAPERKIYVPAASLDTYKAANGWKDYADSIFALDNGEEEPDEEWISLGEGFYRDDILSSLYSTDAIGIIVPVEIAQHHEDKSRYRLIDPYSRESITYILGGVPSDMVFTSPGYIEFVIDPETGNVEILNSPLGFQMDFGDGNGALDISVQLLTDANKAPLYGSYYEDRGIIKFTTRNSIVFVNTNGSGYYVNRNALFAIAMPGYDFDEPIDSEGSKIYYTATASLVKSFGTSAFNVAIVSNEWDEATGEGVITFDGELTTIGGGAFFYCGSLTSVTIPDSVTTIGDSAFYFCSSLTSVTIPDSVTTIGNYAFYSCGSLTSVTIPDSVTTIGHGAFCYCGLTSLTIPDSVTTIGGGVFEGCSNLAEFKGKFAEDGGRCLIIDGVLNAFALGCGVTEYTIPDSVTTIGGGVFLYCESLTSVTIPDSVTTIGSGAFGGCINLAEFKGKFAEDGGRCLIIDGVLNAFALGCGVTEYTIPDSVTTIGEAAFFNCDSLTSVTIPDSVTTIGEAAFLYCYSLTSVTIGNSVTTIGEDAFSSCGRLTSVTIPDSVTMIGAEAFWSCESLTSVTIGDSVTTIGDYAFRDCRSLTSVYCEATTPPGLGYNAFKYYDNGLVNIGCPIYVPAESVEAYKAATNWSEYAADIVGYNFETGEVDVVKSELFYTATALVEPYKASAFNVAIVSNEWDSTTGEGVITFDGELTTIGDWAFALCDRLTSVTIPDSVTTIGVDAFYDCYSLTSVTIPDSVTTIGNWAFEDCDSLTSVTIPDSVTTIGGGVFGGCSNLAEFKGKFAENGGRCLIKDNTIIAYANASGTTYTIPDSVTSIGDGAFYGCRSLTSVTIPDSVTTIGDDAFYDCNSLTSVTIPDSVTTIGEAFYSCDSLTSVYCEATTPPTLDGNGFHYSAPSRKIYVPADSVEAYKAAKNWSEYASSIVAYDFETGEEVIVVKSELFYTATALVEPHDTSGFNAAIVSNKWDETTGEGVISFDGELTTIGDYAFSWYDSLTSVTIPDSVTTIGNGAFYRCESLTSVTIGNSVTTIGEGAFASCKSLTEFKGKFAADGGRCLIKDNTLIAYANASGTTYTIPDSVTTIGDRAFYGCSSLTSVAIPDSVTTIGWYAFAYCADLTSVTIPDSVTTIGRNAFENCDRLTSVTIGDSVTTIGDEAFISCDSLTEFKGKFAEDGGRCLIKDNTIIAYAYASGTTYTIPDSVTTIGNWAFGGCGSLTSVTIPDSVTTIGNYAFVSCHNLESVTIPDSVTTIGGNAFENCDRLTSVTIGDGVTTIGDYAFADCRSLTSVYCKATTPPSMVGCAFIIKSNGIFEHSNIGCAIYVPAASVEAYKAAENWSEYAADIVGYDFE